MSDHEHRAYEVWDGDSRWAPARLEQTVSYLEERIGQLEQDLADLRTQGA